MTSTELVDGIETIILDKGDAGLGFNIRGGVDNVHVEGDPGVFVTTIKLNGAAAMDGRMQPGDKILEINGNDLRCVLHAKAVNYFHAAGNQVTLLVDRGAEQKITSSNVGSDAHVSYDNSALVTVVRRRRSWVWLPISIVIGGSAVALFYWYWRRRMQ